MTASASFRGAVVALGLLALTSCTNLNDEQARMVSGGAIGAVTGLVGTAVTGGCIPCGTVIGAAVGVGAGYVIDQLDKSTKGSSSSSPPPSSYYNSNPPPAPPGSYGAPMGDSPGS